MTNALKLKIKGMTCNSCSKAITTRLSKFEFTGNVDIDWETGSGSLEVNDDFQKNSQTVLQAITQLGYDVTEA